MNYFIRNPFFWLGLFSLVACSSTHPAQSSTAMLWKIDHYKVPCMGNGPMLCYLLTRDADDPEYFYDDIEGFQYEWGYTYEIEVEQLPVDKPMSDGSAFNYRMVKEISKVAIPAGTSFELPLTLEDQLLVIPGDDGCTYLEGIAIYPGNISCQELAAQPRGLFRHRAGGGLEWMEEK